MRLRLSSLSPSPLIGKTFVLLLVLLTLGMSAGVSRGQGSVVPVVPVASPESTSAGVRTAPGDLPAKVALRFEEPALVNMPVWVHLTLPAAYEMEQANLRYPFTDQPDNFGPYSFEVMFEGKPVARRPNPIGHGEFGVGYGGSAAPPNAPTGRLPLHLQYCFNKPGKYMVRCIAKPYLRHPSSPAAPIYSEWTEVDVKPFSESQRVTWQANLIAHSPSDPGQIVGDYLPSLLADPDEAVLPVLAKYIYYSDPNRLAPDYAPLVPSYALMSLDDFYPGDIVRREIFRMIKVNGPTDLLAHQIIRRHKLFQPQARDLAEVIIPYLKSDSPIRVGGAVQALCFMLPQNDGSDNRHAPGGVTADTRNRTPYGYDWSTSPSTPKEIREAVWKAVPHIIDLQDAQALHPLVLFLGTEKSDRSRELLWKLSANQSVREQALICLCWIGDPHDLDSLGEILLLDDATARSLPYHLRDAFGVKAIPYLLKGLEQAPSIAVRLACAKELAHENQVEAFRFYEDALKGKPWYRSLVVPGSMPRQGESLDSTQGNPPYKGQILQDLRDFQRSNSKMSESKLLQFVQGKIRELQE